MPTRPLEDTMIVVAERATPPPTPRVEPSPRWVRAVVDGTAVADSKAVMTVTLGLPAYYVPVADVRMDLLEPSERKETSSVLGERSFWHLRVGDRVIENAAWAFAPPTDGPKLVGYVAFYWDRIDHWYEEDDEVFVHPRDPYHRVDVLSSSRHVSVIAGGEVVAE